MRRFWGVDGAWERRCCVSALSLPYGPFKKEERGRENKEESAGSKFHAGTSCGGGRGRLGASPTAQGPAKWTAALDSAVPSKAGLPQPYHRAASFWGKRQPAWLAHRARSWSSYWWGWRSFLGPSFLLVSFSQLPRRLQPERQPPGQRLHVRNGGASAQVPHTSGCPSSSRSRPWPTMVSVSDGALWLHTQPHSS